MGIEFAPELVAASKMWLYSELSGWRRSFKPGPAELLAMAEAMTQLAGTLRDEARGIADGALVQSEQERGKVGIPDC